MKRRATRNRVKRTWNARHPVSRGHETARGQGNDGAGGCRGV